MKSKIHKLAGELYSAYCDAVDWTAFNGDRLPNWLNFSEDPTKEKQVKAWLAAAERAISLLQPE